MSAEKLEYNSHGAAGRGSQKGSSKDSRGIVKVGKDLSGPEVQPSIQHHL